MTMRDKILEWMSEDSQRTVYLASVHFSVEPQDIWDALKGVVYEAGK